MTSFVRRTKAIAHKEVLHMIRDARVLYLALGLPVIMLLLFGYGISTDVDHVPIAVVDQDQTRASRRLAEAMVAGHSFEIASRSDTPEDTYPQLRRGDIDAVLVIPAGFQRDLERGDPTRAQLLVDGTDGTVASIAIGDAVGAARSLAAPEIGPPPVVQRFNPVMRSAYNFVPGVIALILAMVSSLLAGLTVAREWERGSMEQLFATPVRRVEVMVGKLLPYVGIGMVQVLLVLTMGSCVFAVPVAGSLGLLFGAALLFLMGMLGQGLLVSVITRNQQVATQVGIMSSMLPTLLLSGFVSPIENMPFVLRALSAVLPARYFITVLRGVMLKGNGVAELWPQLLAMLLFALAMIGLSTARFKRRLD